MSVWLALQIKQSHGIDIDEILTEISNKKNERFQDIKE
jgi:Flp pilus assembly protein TadB